MQTVYVQLRTEAEMESLPLYTIFLILCASCLFEHVCRTEGKLFNATACPLSQETWEEKAKVYNCTGGIKYTCILNENDTFVEGCLPAYPVSENQANCPFLVSYTQQPISSKYFTNCNITWQGCPPNTHHKYTIAELWKYPQCLIRQNDRGPGIFTTTSTQTPTAEQTTEHFPSTTTPRSTTNQISAEVIAGTVLGIVGLLGLAIVVFFIVRWRRSGKGGKGKQGKKTDVMHGTPLVDSSKNQPSDATQIEDEAEADSHPFLPDVPDSNESESTEFALAEVIGPMAESPGPPAQRRSPSLSTDKSDSSSSGVDIDNSHDVANRREEAYGNLPQSPSDVYQQTNTVDPRTTMVSARERLIKAILNRNTSETSAVLQSANFTMEDFKKGLSLLIKGWDSAHMVEEIIHAAHFNPDELIIKPPEEEREVPVLLYAARCGSRNIVTHLLDKLKDINITDKGCHTILHYSVEFGWMDVVEKIMELDRQMLNEVTIDNETAFIIAAKFGHKEVVSYLLGEGASVLDRFDQYTTIVKECVTNKWPDILKKSLNRDRAKLLSSSPDKGAIIRTVLTSTEERDDFVEICLNEFPDMFNKHEYFHKQHPLLWAADLKDLNLCKYLLSKLKADDVENAFDDHGVPLLHMCINRFKQSKHQSGFWFSLFEQLVKWDAGSHRLINGRDHRQNTPILLAVKRGRKEFFDLLTKQPGIDFFLYDNKGINLLHECVRRKWYQRCLKVLTCDREKRLLNSQDNDAMTPLMIAVSNKSNYKIVELLINSGADISKHDKERKTVLHFFVDTFEANDDNWTKSVKLVLDLMVSKELKSLLEFRNKQRQTPLQQAELKKKAGCAQLFELYLKTFSV